MVRDPGYAALLREAVFAPEDTTELRDPDGRVARIQRDASYPGAKCIRLDAAEGATPCPVQWVLPATNTRPTFYPPELPFLPGIACRAMEGGGRFFVIWRDPGCPVVDPENAAEFRDSMPSSMQAAIASMKAAQEGGKAEASGREARFKEFQKHFQTEEVQEWMASMARARDPDPRFVAGFDAVLEACLKEGWEEEPKSPKVFPAVRTISLRRVNFRRVLVLSSMMGIGSIFLTQEEDKGTDSSPCQT